jgi:hypothetical protein
MHMGSFIAFDKTKAMSLMNIVLFLMVIEILEFSKSARPSSGMKFLVSRRINDMQFLYIMCICGFFPPIVEVITERSLFILFISGNIWH